MKFKHGKYWFEMNYQVIDGKRRWFWVLKACNGKPSGWSRTLYYKRCLCYNNAKALADYIGLEVR